MLKSLMILQKFQKASGTSPYIWSIVSILPFYYIFQSSSKIEIIVGLLLTTIFFISLRFAFVSTEWPIYMWTSIMIGVSIALTILFQFVYFSFFIAYFNGHIKNRAGFLTIYIIHLVASTVSINYNIVVLQDALFFKQLPIIIIIYIGVILLPFNIYNRKKQDQLEEQLEDANKRISELVKQEERQRIARDLHDTLGQKLSLIGLKSDLARKLIYKDPEQAKDELKDVQQTARTALNEVRKMVSQMRGIRIKEEIAHIEQFLKAAQIEFKYKRDSLYNVSLFVENILSLCMKETVTNVVKHSQATTCEITIEQSWNEICIVVKDNGIGINEDEDVGKGSGLLGIKERLEFVNGSLNINAIEGTTIIMRVPTVVKGTDKEGQI
ncbi:sensor histidine kinase [Bacillus sp. 2205SS5-2]|uniref:sensor histidine kinase n=1 Tax=Bacillus sp. 2205SS5-2 TaxID=3109031 RepID=UPI003004B820